MKLRHNSIKKFLNLICAKAEKAQKNNQQIKELCLTVTDNVGIRKLNLKYFKSDTITDVISFRYQPVPGNLYPIGDIIVNAEKALSPPPAIARRWSPQKEFALYIAHGCDHLYGGEDETLQKRRKMRRKELRWLSDPKIAAQIPKLLCS